MLGELISEIVAAALAAAIIGAFGFVWRLLTRIPLVMMLLGVGLLGIALTIGASFTTANFRTEGSPAGTIAFVVLGSVVAAATLAGLVLTVRGLVGMAQVGPGSPALGLLFAVVALGVVFMANRTVRSDGPSTSSGRWVRAPAERASGDAALPRPPIADGDLRPARSVEARGTYALAWKAREGAPAMSLLVPAALLHRGARPEAAPLLEETADGPRALELLLVDVPVGPASVRLHRDESTLDDVTHAALHSRPGKGGGTPHFLWIDTEREGWRLLGWHCPGEAANLSPALQDGWPACHVPDGVLARWIPSLFGPDRIRVDVRADPAGCRMTFAYRGRPVTVASPGACFSDASRGALGAAAQLLEGLVRDAAQPPSAPERVARARAAMTRCESLRAAAPAAALRALERPEARAARQSACAYAGRVAEPELEASPAETAPLLLRLLDNGSPVAPGREPPLLDGVIRALDATQPEGTRELVLAHTLRLEAAGQSPQGLARRSLDVVLDAAPRVLSPSDALFERALAAIVRVRLHPTDEVRRLAALQALDGRAAMEPGLAVALRVRLSLCRQRLQAALERERLKGCADELFAAWESGNALLTGAASEAELAVLCARMYGSWGMLDPAHAAPAVDGLRRVKQRAEARFASRPEFGSALEVVASLESSLGRRRTAGRG